MKKRVEVNDRMQSKYVYFCTEPMGKHFDPEFQPELTPKEMLELRCPDDARQIKRWRAMCRHVAQIRKHCPEGETECRPRQRQALLHWAYDSRTI